VVEADVVGSAGTTRVSGATLRARFGLFDSWAYFTSIASRRVPAPEPAGPPPGANDETGGTGPVIARVRPIAGLAGAVMPARRGVEVAVERRFLGQWVPAGSATVGRGGRYTARVTAPGLYRVRFKGDAGPAVRIR
jgi:stage II sporulation protein D